MAEWLWGLACWALSALTNQSAPYETPSVVHALQAESARCEHLLWWVSMTPAASAWRVSRSGGVNTTCDDSRGRAVSGGNFFFLVWRVWGQYFRRQYWECSISGQYFCRVPTAQGKQRKQEKWSKNITCPGKHREFETLTKKTGNFDYSSWEFPDSKSSVWK